MKHVVYTEKSPKPIGPYSQAIEIKPFLFCSGAIALDPITGAIDPSILKDVEAQTCRVLENIGGVLSAAGLAFDDVVKTTIFLKSMDDFPKVNVIYAKYFSNSPPARSTIEVSRLPKDALIEIEVIAYKPEFG